MKVFVQNLQGITQKKIEEANAAAMKRAADKVGKEQKDLANAKIKSEMLKKQAVSRGVSIMNGMEGPCAGPEEKSKKEDGQEDPRGMKTKINLSRNKLRSMGLKMSYDMEGKLTEKKELSVDDQMRISRDAAKDRNPNPDHQAIRGRQIRNSKAPKDTRPDAEKMTDATGPRPGSRYRGD